MIRLTRLRQSDPLYVNPDHIERLHRLHETVVHLLNGNEYVVVESPEEIVEQITRFRARAIALAARMAIERATDGVRWHALVDRLSQAGIHRSWRRAALLALARSEAAEALLQRASPELLTNSAALLREIQCE